MQKEWQGLVHCDIFINRCIKKLQKLLLQYQQTVAMLLWGLVVFTCWCPSWVQLATSWQAVDLRNCEASRMFHHLYSTVSGHPHPQTLRAHFLTQETLATILLRTSVSLDGTVKANLCQMYVNLLGGSHIKEAFPLKKLKNCLMNYNGAVITQRTPVRYLNCGSIALSLWRSWDFPCRENRDWHLHCIPSNRCLPTNMR